MAHGVEERLMSLLRDGALDELASQAVESYGSELYGFLIHVLGDPTGPEDVFAQTIEDFWRGLPGFRGRCSVRTWLYKLAHHASVSYLRSPWYRAPRAASSAPSPLIAAARTLTVSWRRADVKDRWRELRREIAAEDRALLVLRVDRDLGWDEIAHVMLSESSDDASAMTVTREAERLRTRFQLLKDQLRARARAVGLR
ncbi:MAG TPA: sigma-70 family RNA polymerase sigma factor [Kofleriaceae bacterium]|nr:sigma-70 family RNA polymerase sigma factor [Kofleriaceae bacterium]